MEHAAGEKDGTWMRLTELGGLDLIRPCNVRSGSWGAQGRMFVADLGWGRDLKCGELALGLREWMTAGVSWRPTPAGWQIVDARGRAVATMHRAGPISTADITRIGPHLRRVPGLTAKSRRWLDSAPAPLPAGYKPPSRAELLGYWQLIVPPGVCDRAHVWFTADGLWTGSDYAGNARGGFWRLEADGSLLASHASSSTLVGCVTQGALSPEQMDAVADFGFGAGRVGLRHGRLFLFDRDGTPHGKLRKTQPPARLR